MARQQTHRTKDEIMKRHNNRQLQASAADSEMAYEVLEPVKAPKKAKTAARARKTKKKQKAKSVL